MNTVHAWFSFETALRAGSALYRKPGGDSVNVTRMSAERQGRGPFPQDEKYLGEVIAALDGGCIRGTTRVPGIGS
jgi:hypothetical protein